MSKEKRLGRGLEALLGQISGRNESALPAQYNRPPGAPDAQMDQEKEEPVGIAPHPRPVPPPDFLRVSGRKFRACHNCAARAARRPGLCPAASNAGPPGRASRVRIDLIDSNPNQPRQDFDGDEIQKLSESISAHGLLQPVVVRRVNDRYQIIAGERRFAGGRASRVERGAGATLSRPTTAKPPNWPSSKTSSAKISTPWKKPPVFSDIWNSTAHPGRTGARLNLDRSTIANLIRLLELPAAVQDALRRGDHPRTCPGPFAFGRRT